MILRFLYSYIVQVLFTVIKFIFLVGIAYLGWDSVEVLSQHPPHVLAGVRRHLVLKQEGEHAAFTDAVEVAVHLVVLAA